MNIWRIAGVALIAGLALFLLSVVVKLLLIAAVAALVFNVIGRQIARRYYGSSNRQPQSVMGIVSIDNPAFH
jgi:membrane protein implicated in regulation of membrane protease activity